MPTIALTICIIFVIYMLWIDHKQFPEASIALWIPTIWMFIIWSRSLGDWFRFGGSTIEEGSPLDRYFLYILLCIGIIILVKRKFHWANAIKENGWLIVLLAYMLVSCFWSDMPFISFKRWFRQFIAIIMAFVMVTEPNPQKSLESIFRRIVYITIPFSFLLIQYFGEYGRAYLHHSGDMMWIGVTGHKNQLCQLCLFAILFLVWTFIKRKQGRDLPVSKYQTYLEAFILIVTFWIMGGPAHSFTYSATSTMAFVVGLVAIIRFFYKKRLGSIPTSKTLIAIILFIVIYGTMTPMLGRLSIFDVSSMVGREDNLTGRADVWDSLIPAVMEQPLLGYGYGGFWSTTARGHYDFTDAHNGYLGVILELGLVGLLLNVIFLFSSSIKAQSMMTQDFDWGTLWLCFILILVVHSIAESSLTALTTRLMSLILLFTVSFSINKVPKKQNTI